MQSTYAQKNETIQKASANTAESVVDSSSQSATLQRHASLANAAVQRAENPPRPNNTGLPDDLKNGVESLSGYSLDNVRVHYNSPKPATVQALAYTQGTDIHVAPGQEHALPHEAWHVTQQMAGRVTPTTNIGGMPVNDNAALEHEADVMGEKAVQCKKNTSPQKISFNSQNTILQLKTDHLFNDIPKVLMNLGTIKISENSSNPIALYKTKSEELFGIYAQLNDIRDDNDNKKDGVHSTDEQDSNLEAFTNAERLLKGAFEKKRTNRIKGHVESLFNASVDEEVAAIIPNSGTKIDKWKSFSPIVAKDLAKIICSKSDFTEASYEKEVGDDGRKTGGWLKHDQADADGVKWYP